MPRFRWLRRKGHDLVARANAVDFNVRPLAVTGPLAADLHRAQIKTRQIKCNPIGVISWRVAPVASRIAQAATGLVRLRPDPLRERPVGQPRPVASLPGNGKNVG